MSGEGARFLASLSSGVEQKHYDELDAMLHQLDFAPLTEIALALVPKADVWDLQRLREMIEQFVGDVGGEESIELFLRLARAAYELLPADEMLKRQRRYAEALTRNQATDLLIRALEVRHLDPALAEL